MFYMIDAYNVYRKIHKLYIYLYTYYLYSTKILKYLLFYFLSGNFFGFRKNKIKDNHTYKSCSH